MAITVTNINVNLDTNKLGHKIDERFLQGNADKNLVVRLLKNGENISVTDGTKPDITIVYYNANNTIANKFVYSPLKTDGSPNSEYTITGASGGIIEIPFTAHKAFADHAGRTDIILKLKDGNEYYTYSCTCYFDKNEAYDHGGIIDNFPKIDDIKAEITTVDNKVNTLAGDVANNKVGVAKIPAIQTDVLNLKTDNTQNKADIAANKQTLTTKANHDLSNVGEFSTAADGELLFKKDNTLKQSGIIVDTAGKVIHSPYSLEVPPNTLNLGSNISVHENGGFVEYETKTLGKDYILLDYENDPTLGSKKPIYYERGTKRTKVDIQPVDTTSMNNISIVNLGKGTMDKQVQAIYMKLVNSVTNLSFKININGADVGYYPSKEAWDSGKDGLDLASGLQKIDLKPYWTTLTEYTTVVTFKADGPINVLGNGTLPYFAQDLNHILRKEMALMDDLSNVDHTGLAKNDLTNVTDDTFLKKGVQAGLLQQDLADIDIQKLEEKYELTDDFKATQRTLSDLENELTTKADEDLSNVSTGDLDKAIRLTNAYKQIANRHPDNPTPTQIETGLFYLEEQSPIVDWTPYINNKFIHLVFQFTSDNQTITQTLPPAIQNKAIIVSVLGNFANPTLNIQPSSGEQINGAYTPVVINEQGVAGVFIAETLIGNYQWIPYPMMHDTGIGVNDQKSNFFLGQQNIAFGAGFTATQDPTDAKTVKIDYTESGTGGTGATWKDSITGEEFVPTKIESLDKSIRVGKLLGVTPITADLSVDALQVTDGLFAKLGYEEDINTDFHDQRPYFGSSWRHFTTYLGEDLNDKAWTIQEGDDKDPLVSGGTEIRLGMYFEALDYEVASNDGYVELKVIDVDTKDYLMNPDGEPITIRREYKAGQKIGKELLVNHVRAKGQKKIAFEIDVSFGGQIIKASSNTCIFMQVVDNQNITGLAEMMFENETGYRIITDTRYYGTNNMNFAASLVKDKPEQVLNNEYELMGNGLFVDVRRNCKVSISNYKLNISDNGGIDLPVFYVGKLYDAVDTFELLNKSLAVTVKISNPDMAFFYGLFKWTGTGEATLPIITGYQNMQPIISAGWTEVPGKQFISENVGGVEGTYKNAFTVPADAKQFAIVLYPEDSQEPTNMHLGDFEADVLNPFTKTIIRSNSHLSEEHLEYNRYLYRAITKTPSGLVRFRYTVNSTPVKIPFGIVSGGANDIVNDYSWSTGASAVPYKIEGDGKFLRDGKINLTYQAQVYTGESVPDGGTSNCFIYLAKKQGDGSFVEIPNSRYSFVCIKSDKNPKTIKSNNITFDVKANDVIRVMAGSSIDDGCYLQSGTNGIPLFRLDIDYQELTVLDQSAIDKLTQNNEVSFIEDGKEVFNKILEFDVKSGKMTVKDK